MKPIAKIFGADVFFDDGVHRVFDQHQTRGYGARYGVTKLGSGTVLETNSLDEAIEFAHDKGKSARQIENEVHEILSGDTDSPSEPTTRRTATLRPMRISAIDPATMTAGAINKELDKLDERSSALGQMMIDAGRGYERPSEYLEMRDPLSLELLKEFNRRHDLKSEISRRYGPGAPHRLPTGSKDRRFFGPRKKKGE